ncbi:M50 family metallopeptidase [Salipaludibacillus sp. LMS25]|jgi:hypothetical protein|uniref:M50 family metallopeptidase n=1 Tax=Salipaludibacillus sp. LMS25 TaxID=2924031 RepID=UPI0020D183DF|nr:M50 family metallopeptidase [Salipaludibacillus sp. LMS25]UTR13665.1 M50 family metallopeptidase [Salipaludibacillus sp. LMS25]
MTVGSYGLSILFKFQETFFLYVILCVCLFFFILLHELGHVIAGKLVGFQFEFLTIGPLTISKSNEEITFSQNESWELVGGITRSYLSTKNEVRKRVIIYTAGGPFISLILATMFLIFNLFFGLEILFYSFLLNLGLFVATILPVGNNSITTDGKCLLILFRNNSNTKWYLNNFLLMNELLSLKRPRNWDRDTVNYFKGKLNSKNTECEYKDRVCTLIYYHQTDVDNNKERLVALDELLSFELSEDLKEIVSSSYILFEFLNPSEDMDYSYLEQLYEELDSTNKSNESGFLRAKCIISFLTGQIKVAKEELSKLESLQQNFENGSLANTYGFLRLEKDWLKELKRKINPSKM